MGQREGGLNQYFLGGWGGCWVFLCSAPPTLIGAVGREAIALLQGAEMDSLAGLAFSIETDTLHLDDVVCILRQIPQHTGPVRGVHLSDESLHLSVLSLPEPGRWLEGEGGGKGATLQLGERSLSWPSTRGLAWAGISPRDFRVPA